MRVDAGADGDRVRRNLVLAICCTSVFIVGTDLSVVNVALPSIQRALGASVTDLQWTVDAYSLTIASLLILAGSLADRFGRRRAFQVGLVVFSAGSLLCGLAPGLGWLIAFRAVQAVGGSLLNPVAISIIVTVFPDRLGKARATGIWASVAGLSIATGPVIGGILVSGLGWRSIFWINVPIGVGAVVLTQRFVPESKAARVHRLDLVGEVLVASVLASTATVIIEGPRQGWGSPVIVTLISVAAALLVALIVVELRVRHPLIDLRLFRSVPYSGATVVAVTSPAILGGFLFLNTLYLQEVRGESALGAGLHTIPMALMFAVFSIVSGRLLATTGPRLPLLLAGVLLVTGPMLLVSLTPQTSVWYLTTAYVILGAGFGLATVPVTNMAVSGMPPDQAGTAGGVLSTCRQFGFAVGVAVCGSIVYSTGGPGFTSSSHAAWGILAGGGALILVIGLASTSRSALRTASRYGHAARPAGGGDELWSAAPDVPTGPDMTAAPDVPAAQAP